MFEKEKTTLKLKIKIIRFFKLIRYKRICKALGLEQRNDLTAYVMDGDETILGFGLRTIEEEE